MTQLSEIKARVSQTETRASGSMTEITKTDTHSSKTETPFSEGETAFSGNMGLFGSGHKSVARHSNVECGYGKAGLLFLFALFCFSGMFTFGATDIPAWLLNGQMSHSILREADHDVQTLIGRQEYLWTAPDTGVVRIACDANDGNEPLIIQRQPEVMPIAQTFSYPEPETLITPGTESSFLVERGEILRILILDFEQRSVDAAVSPPPQMSFHTRFEAGRFLIVPSDASVSQGALCRITCARRGPWEERRTFEIRQPSTETSIPGLPTSITFEKGSREVDLVFVVPSEFPLGTYKLGTPPDSAGPELETIATIEVKRSFAVYNLQGGDSIDGPASLYGQLGDVDFFRYNATADMLDGDGDLEHDGVSVWVAWTAPADGAFVSLEGSVFSVRDFSQPRIEIAKLSREKPLAVDEGKVYLIRINARSSARLRWVFFEEGGVVVEHSKVKFTKNKAVLPLSRVGGSGDLEIRVSAGGTPFPVTFRQGETRKVVEIPVVREAEWTSMEYQIEQEHNIFGTFSFTSQIDLPPQIGVPQATRGKGIVNLLNAGFPLDPYRGRFEFRVGATIATGWFDLGNGRVNFKAALSRPTPFSLPDGRQGELVFTPYLDTVGAIISVNGIEEFAMVAERPVSGPTLNYTFHAPFFDSQSNTPMARPSGPIFGSMKFSGKSVRIVGRTPEGGRFSCSTSRMSGGFSIFARVSGQNGHVFGFAVADDSAVYSSLQWVRPPLVGKTVRSGFIQEYGLFGAVWQKPLPEESDPFWSPAAGAKFAVQVEQSFHAAQVPELMTCEITHRKGGDFVLTPGSLDGNGQPSSYGIDEFQYNKRTGFFRGKSNRNGTVWSGVVVRGQAGLGSTSEGFSVRMQAQE